MYTLRCTQKLLRRVESPTLSEAELPRSTTLLGDWYANIVIIRRQHLVLTVSGSTLLPVVLPPAPINTVPNRVAEGVEQMLRALGVDEAKIAAERAAMADCTIARSDDRRILGSMNDFTNLLDGYLDGAPLLSVALKISEAPCSPLGMARPREVTIARLRPRRSGC